MSRIKNRSNLKNEKGAISLFVVLAMMFFLVFMIGAFTMVSRRNQQQAASMAELQKVYKKDGNIQYDNLMGTGDVYIPINNLEDYNKMLTDEPITIDGITYKATEDAKYMFTSDIEIDMSLIEGFRADNLDDYKFKDYIIYNENYYVDLNGYDVYYMIDSDGDGIKERFKLLVFDGVGEESLIGDNRKSGTSTRFSIYNDAANYSTMPHVFLLYIEKNGRSQFDTLVKDETYFVSNVETEAIPTIDKIPCVESQVDKSDKYFLFIQYNETYSALGKNAYDEISIGDYVDYKLSYQLLIDSDEDDAKENKGPTTDTWRVFSKDNGKIQLICTNSPIKYTFDGTKQHLVDDLLYNFKDTTFKAKNGRNVKGSYFINAFAESVKNMDYSSLSKFITDSDEIDYITAAGGLNKTSLKDGYKNYETGWQSYKVGMLNNGTDYWIPHDNAVEEDNLYYVNSKATDVPLFEEIVSGKENFIRPIVTLKENLVIAADSNGVVGDGTAAKPFCIAFREKTASGAEIGDYVLYGESNDDSAKYNYENVSISNKTAEETGWRILDIDEKGKIKLVSAGIPIKYDTYTTGRKKESKKIEDILRDLTTNFENTTFKKKSDYGWGTKDVKGKEYFNEDYAEEIYALKYDEFSNLIYGNSDYITVSYNEDFGYQKNTVNESQTSFLINNWNENKKGLVNLGVRYLLGSKTETGQKIGVHNNNYLINSLDSSISEVGIRIVVVLKDSAKIISGTGEKNDPYRLSSDESADLGVFRVGEYVTYDGILDYENISKNSITASTEDETLTGWRVFSYSNGELKLISAGVPYYATANLESVTSLNSKNYAEYIKNFEYDNIEIRTFEGYRITNSYNPQTLDLRINKVECMDYNQYTSLLSLYNNGEIEGDLIFSKLHYWLGAYYERIRNTGNSVSIQYNLRYINQAGDAYTADQNTYGIRPIITIKKGYTVEKSEGTPQNPHKLIFHN